MHELALLESLVALVEDEQARQGFVRVKVVRVKVGALGHAAPEALHFGFSAATQGTVAEGARLEIETIPGAGWCVACSRKVSLSERYGSCPLCDHFPVLVTAGAEFHLSEIEVE